MIKNCLTIGCILFVCFIGGFRTCYTRLLMISTLLKVTVKFKVTTEAFTFPFWMESPERFAHFFFSFFFQFRHRGADNGGGTSRRELTSTGRMLSAPFTATGSSHPQPPPPTFGDKARVLSLLKLFFCCCCCFA